MKLKRDFPNYIIFDNGKDTFVSKNISGLYFVITPYNVFTCCKSLAISYMRNADHCSDVCSHDTSNTPTNRNQSFRQFCYYSMIAAVIIVLCLWLYAIILVYLKHFNLQ